MAGFNQVEVILFLTNKDQDPKTPRLHTKLTSFLGCHSVSYCTARTNKSKYILKIQLLKQSFVNWEGKRYSFAARGSPWYSGLCVERSPVRNQAGLSIVIPRQW